MSHHQRSITIFSNPERTEFCLPDQNQPGNAGHSPSSSVCSWPTNLHHRSSFLSWAGCAELGIMALHGLLGSGGNISVKPHISHLLGAPRLTCSTAYRSWGETGKLRGLPTLQRRLQSSTARTFPGQKQEVQSQQLSNKWFVHVPQADTDPHKTWILINTSITFSIDWRSS